MRPIARWTASRFFQIAIRYREWRFRVNNPEDCEKAQQLDRDLQNLLLSGVENRRTKAVLNEPEATIETFPWFSAVLGFLAVLLGSLTPIWVTGRAVSIATSLDLSTVKVSLERFQQGFDALASDGRVASIEGALAAPVFFAVSFAWTRWYLLYILPNPLPDALVHRCVHAIRACARAHEQSPAFVRRARLRAVDRACHSVEKNVLKIHRASRAMARRSPRKVHVRKHSAIVVGVLRSQMCRIDTEGDRALRDLAETLAEISERYANGCLGALLPDTYRLDEVTPVSTSRSTILESLHVVATLTAGLGAAIAISVAMPSLPVPKDLRPWVVLLMGVSAAIAVAGWRGVIRILQAFPGR